MIPIALFAPYTGFQGTDVYTKRKATGP